MVIRQEKGSVSILFGGLAQLECLVFKHLLPGIPLAGLLQP